jgi:biopolymer transport protein ExbD
MPVKLSSKLPTESAEARIEIVPLIDIMFFLLASFMLVSLSMVSLKTVKVNLPTATTGTPDAQKDMLDISIDKSGGAFIDATPIAPHELAAQLQTDHARNPNIRVFISGDQDARHGAVMAVLDAVRSAGIDKVAFQIQPTQSAPASQR